MSNSEPDRDRDNVDRESVDRENIDHEALIDGARRQVSNSYAPFSKFRAGALVISTSGSEHPGVIVENVSLGLAMCAERVAMFNTIAAGERPLALALAAPDTDGELTWPCGACVQVALELGGPDMLIVAGAADGGPPSSTTVETLLPRGPKVDLDARKQ